MAACTKCGKQVGCGCNLKSGMCSTCRGAVIPPVVNPTAVSVPQPTIPTDAK